MKAWARWNRAWWPDLGAPHRVPYIDQVKGSIDSYAEPEDYDERIDLHQLRALDRAVENLQPQHRMAIRAVYMRETAPSRINGYSRADLVAICEQAELALIPALRKRNVLL